MVIVGANGAGKSALGTWMVGNTRGQSVRRLIAHRRIWMASSGPEISPAQRAKYVEYSKSWDASLDSRYVDNASDQRANITLFDLLGLLNLQNSQMADLYEQGDADQTSRAIIGERVLSKLNRILAAGGLKVQMRLTVGQTFSAWHTGLDVEYPIAQMSDGEKSALMLAADVLTASDNSIVIIDEPERHLHRSISAALVDAIVASRADCAFVVLTHDLELAAALAPRAETHVLMGCRWEGAEAKAWTLNCVPVGAMIPDLARQSILGGRAKVIFIEGDPGSIDLSLYSALFPEWTCSPAGGCESVIRSVTGVRASSELHWVSAVGIVDGDGRSSPERAALFSKGILALAVNEIESLYYLPAVLHAVADVQAETIDMSAPSLVSIAKSDMLQALGESGVLSRFAAKMAKDEVTRSLVDHLPAQVSAEDIEITVPSPFVRIDSELRELHAADDYESLVKRVSIRDSAARARVASALQFKSIVLYERAARKRILEDGSLRSQILAAVGNLPA